MSTLAVTYPQVRSALKFIGIILGIGLLIALGVKLAGWQRDYHASYVRQHAATAEQLQQYYGQDQIDYNNDRETATITTPTCTADLSVADTAAGPRLTLSFTGYTTTFTHDSLANYLARCAQGLAPTQP